MQTHVPDGKLAAWRGITADILKLGWPSILEQVLVMMIGVFMTMLVGGISAVALAASGMVNSLFFFLQAAFAALSTGATVIISRLTGEGDGVGVRKAALQSLILVVYCSVVLTVLCLVFYEPLLNLFIPRATQPEYYEQGAILFRILLFSLPPLTINIVISGIYRGVGNMLLPLVVSLIVNVAYLIVGLFLINVLDMGIAGAAWAAVAARFLGGLIMVVALYRGRGRISLNRHDGFRLELGMVKRILNIGLPAAMEQIVMQGGFLVLNIVIYTMADVDKVTYPIVMNINSISFMPGFGLGMATATLVGHSLGAGDPRRAERINFCSTALAIAMMIVISAALALFAQPIAGAYTDEADVLALSVQCIRVLALGAPFMAAVTILSATLRTGGDIKFVMYSTILGIWIIRIAMSWGLHHFWQMGIIGVIWMLLADFLIRTGLYAWRVRQGRWKSIRV